MPNVTIVTRKGWITDRTALIEAVHSALIEGLKIPSWDRTMRVVEHEPDAFAAPPHCGARYTLVEITLFSGRTVETKRRLYRAVVHALEAMGVPGTDVKITLFEVPPENWGVRGGQLASEIDLGFEVRV